MADTKETVYLDFGRKLKKARRTKKVTQSDLADRVGLTRTSITNIECGRQHVSLHMFLALSDAVGVQPETLLPKLSLSPTVDDQLKKQVTLQTRGNVVEAAAVMGTIAKLKGSGT